jgi:hypothetical protein
VNSERNDVQYIRGYSIDTYRGTKYSIAYKKGVQLHTNNAALCRGLGLKKAIIYAISPQLEFDMDFTGKLGAGPNTFIVPFETAAQGRKLQSFLSSDIYRTLALATKSNRQFLKLAFVEYLNFSYVMGMNGKKMTAKKKTETNKKTRKRKSKH